MSRPGARRSVIVSGGGAGIGAAIARRLADDGDRIGVFDRDAGGANDVASEVGGQALVGSVTDPAQVEAALDQFGCPDVAVLAAGIVRFGALVELSEAAWQDVVDVNLTGSFRVARAVAGRLIEEGRPGSIIVITSINGRAPGMNAGAYGTTKAALAMLVRQMALEWAEHGIRVNAVAPGLIDGGLSAPIYADPEIRAARESRVPLGRLGTTQDVASAVRWLASPEAEYVTGQELVVDGGVTDSVLATLPRPSAVDGVGIAGSAGGTSSQVRGTCQRGGRE